MALVLHEEYMEIEMKKILLSAALAISSIGVHAASFDCAKASTAIEKAICADGQLSDLDSQLMQVYRKSLADSSSSDSLKAEQRLWLKEVRNSCQDVACLTQAYKGRISALSTTPTASSTDSNTHQTPDNDHAEQQVSQTNSTQPLTPPATQSIAEAVPQSSVTAPTAAEVKNEAVTAKEQHDSTPPSTGISGIFNAIYFVLTALFIAGLVNPKWILRWDAKPNRKKLAGYFFALVLPIGLLGEFTKSDATRKYEEKVRSEKEAERKALSEQQVKATNASQRSPGGRGSGEQASGGWESNPAYPSYARAEDKFISLIRAAKSNGALANPSCNSTVNNLYGQYQGEMDQKLSSAKSLDRDYLSGVMQAHAQILESASATISAVCGVQ